MGLQISIHSFLDRELVREALRSTTAVHERGYYTVLLARYEGTYLLLRLKCILPPPPPMKPMKKRES